MFVTRTKLSFFACQKDAAGGALSSGQQKNRLRLLPKRGGNRRLRTPGLK